MRASPHEPRNLILSLFPQGPSRSRRGPAAVHAASASATADCRTVARVLRADQPRRAGSPRPIAEVAVETRLGGPGRLGAPVAPAGAAADGASGSRCGALAARSSARSSSPQSPARHHRERAVTVAAAPAPSAVPATAPLPIAAPAPRSAGAGAGGRRDLARFEPAGRAGGPRGLGRGGRPHAAHDHAATGARRRLVPVREARSSRRSTTRSSPIWTKPCAPSWSPTRVREAQRVAVAASRTARARHRGGRAAASSSRAPAPDAARSVSSSRATARCRSHRFPGPISGSTARTPASARRSCTTRSPAARTRWSSSGATSSSIASSSVMVAPGHELKQHYELGDDYANYTPTLSQRSELEADADVHVRVGGEVGNAHQRRRAPRRSRRCVRDAIPEADPGTEQRRTAGDRVHAGLGLATSHRCGAR